MQVETWEDLLAVNPKEPTKPAKRQKRYLNACGSANSFYAERRF